jgi:hypothetical protein
VLARADTNKPETAAIDEQNQMLASDSDSQNQPAEAEQQESK